MPLRETLEAMRALQEEGAIRHLGASNFTPTLLDEALLTDNVERALQASERERFESESARARAVGPSPPAPSSSPPRPTCPISLAVTTPNQTLETRIYPPSHGTERRTLDK